MEDGNDRTDPVPPPEDTERPASESEHFRNELDRIREAVEQGRTDTALDLAQLRAWQEEHERELRSSKRTAAVLWVMVILLAAGWIFASWRGYSLIDKHRNLLAQLPGLQDSFGAVSKRVDATQEQVRSWLAGQTSFGDRLAKVEKRVAANLQFARQQSQELAAQVSQRIQEEMDRRLEGLQGRLSRMESSQEAEQARLNQLQNDLAGLRRETSQQMATIRQDSSRGLSDVNQQVAQNKQDLSNLSRRFDHDRTDFEVAKDQTRELAPGVSLHITRTDPSHQSVDGWLQLSADGHFLWVRAQGIERPVTFYSGKDSRPQELVFTRVNKDSILGYLLVPAEMGPAPSDSQLSYLAPAANQ